MRCGPYHGALGSHGAWLLEPYDDLPSSSGLNTTPVEDVREKARLAMEDKYHLGPRELRDVEAADDPELRSAYFREEFYLTMQSLLMHYAMD